MSDAKRRSRFLNRGCTVGGICAAFAGAASNGCGSEPSGQLPKDEVVTATSQPLLAVKTLPNAISWPGISHAGVGLSLNIPTGQTIMGRAQIAKPTVRNTAQVVQ